MCPRPGCAQDAPGQSQPPTPPPPHRDLFTPLPVGQGPGPYARGHSQDLGSGCHAREGTRAPHRRDNLGGVSHCRNRHLDTLTLGWLV